MYYGDDLTFSDGVALRKESVDRNASSLLVYLALIRSLSARRAWIEISMLCSAGKCWAVALRKESVDRNLSFHNSVRRCLVALRKESVDRNVKILGPSPVSISRSPQGERG